MTKDLPLAISGPSVIVMGIEKSIEGHSGDPIDFRTVSDRSASVDAIRHREAMAPS